MAPITRALEAAKPKRMTFSTPHPNVAFQGSLARTRGAAPSQGDEGHSSLPSPACQYRPSRGVLHLAFKPLLRTSQNSVMAKFAEFPFRNCLEIRNGSRIGAQKAAKRGQRSPDQLPLGAIEECSRCLLLFSKQFRKVNSPKFGCSILHRTPSESREDGF